MEIPSYNAYLYSCIWEILMKVIYKTKNTRYHVKTDDSRILKSKYTTSSISTKQATVEINLAPDNFFE